MKNNPQKIKSFIIADVLDRWPQTIPVFLDHHLDCVGCEMAPFETLEDVVRIYHLDGHAFFQEIQSAMAASDDENQSNTGT